MSLHSSVVAPEREASRLSELTPHQRKSGLAAWLGWLFDGLDLHLYTLVAMVFVAELLGTTDKTRPDVAHHASIIQAAFLVGWACGGAIFGMIGDRLGRSRTLVLTILTYALFTGLSYFAHEWWHLMVFRFLAALGIGGEWAVGASLLSETWPKKWRPWIAAGLQCAVNCGILLAVFAVFVLQLFPSYEPRWVFLVGLLPALVTLWIRKAVPETDEWSAAQQGRTVPPLSALFGPGIRRTTWITLSICAISLTGHWTFMFWQQGFIQNHPEVLALPEALRKSIPLTALFWIMVGSLIGNFGAGALASRVGYARALAILFFAYAGLMVVAFAQEWSLTVTYGFFTAIGLVQGAFALFTMCLPPLFPTLLRTTGAGFCYNIGRVFAAGGTVFFGLFAKVGDYRLCLFYAAFLFVPAALLSFKLPQENR
ncbi:MAG: MFS transporter [Opitutus sp.]|nr:MFS transporter [Opitutus sp.]MCS6248056.1 MFS transporter [Opitutus sp.]MCS6275427.1 MFS transporter [Opitutus sp.]MCS6278209.1 MFS transporter [Opitutus sp.]MCS6299319.1 MFS transporter [Opitutus sp.]